MKICWDNLEKLRYNRNTGKWYDKNDGGVVYVYIECCKNCGEPFIGRCKKNLPEYCCKKCSNSSKEKVESLSSIATKQWESEKHRKFMSDTMKEKWMDEQHFFNSIQYKKKISEASKRNWMDERGPYKDIPLKISKKIKSLHEKTNIWKNRKNKKSETKNISSKKGYGYTSNNIPLYDTYAPQLEWCEEVRRNVSDHNVLEVRCTYCGRWYIPTLNNARNRVNTLTGVDGYKGEQRFYCSYGCKQACPLYGKTPETLMREDAVRAGRLDWLELNREVQPELRQMVLKRDEYRCVKCGSTDKPLHCHHIDPVAINPIESADVDNCITLCADCHKEVHQKDGCKYGQLRMEIC